MVQKVKNIVTAGMVAIGDELLVGSTKDKNIGYLAEKLTAVGISLKEVRIVPDDQTAIIEAVNALRHRYHYVFTSGGIGPTHDDITAQSISVAFDAPCIISTEADKLLADFYKRKSVPYTADRRLMARITEGATLIENPVSIAPGFRIKNVFVMAGVPSVFSAMLDGVLPVLQKGEVVKSVSVLCPLPEGEIGTLLAEIQKENPDTRIGSYPNYENGKATLTLIIRGYSSQAIEQAREAIVSMIDFTQRNPH